MYRNRDFASKFVDVGDVILAKQDMLFDPQTSGGLLISVDSKDADKFFEELKSNVPSAQRIGTVREKLGESYIYLH
mgnify:CR=1 FL=1